MNKAQLKRLESLMFDELFAVGENQLKAQKRLDRLKVCYKEAAGVATEVDIKSERRLIRFMKKHGPEAKYIAEESSYKAASRDKDFFKGVDYVWFVDPLDGTNNYLSGMDYFSISIALYDPKSWQAILAMVYRPSTGELVFANPEGTYLKNLLEDSRKTKLTPCLEKESNESILATGFILNKGAIKPDELDLFCKCVGSFRGIRRLGSAALDLAQVASGRLNGFWQRGLNPWDTAAGAFLCSQAGISVSDYSGKKFTPFSDSIVVGPPRVYKKLSTLIRH
jgi:myo-inositol-1(or 4)-monophosphatase